MQNSSFGIWPTWDLDFEHAPSPASAVQVTSQLKWAGKEASTVMAPQYLPQGLVQGI